MRTKVCESVRMFDVTQWEPRPFVYLVYDGLAGISQRPILRDVIEELERKGEWQKFVTKLRTARVHSADVQVYYHDYVSYGIGGGDATSEYLYRTLLLLWNPAVKGDEKARRASIPEHLALERPNGMERVAVDKVWR